MLTDLLLPSSIRVNQATIEENMLKIEVTSVQTEAICPICQQSSQRIHSRYDRTVVDLPWADLMVSISLYVRHFFCDNVSCFRQTFAERLPDLASVTEAARNPQTAPTAAPSRY